MCSFNLHYLLLLQSNDIEISLGHMKSSRLNFCHWNLNGIAAHDFVKVLLIEAFIKAKNIDIIRLSETFLDSTIPLKVRLSPSKKICFLLDCKSFENDEKCFLFHLKSSFRSRYLIFCCNFLVIYKRGLIRNIRLTSKFMT